MAEDKKDGTEEEIDRIQTLEEVTIDLCKEKKFKYYEQNGSVCILGQVNAVSMVAKFDEINHCKGKERKLKRGVYLERIHGEDFDKLLSKQSELSYEDLKLILEFVRVLPDIVQKFQKVENDFPMHDFKLENIMVGRKDSYSKRQFFIVDPGLEKSFIGVSLAFDECGYTRSVVANGLYMFGEIEKYLIKKGCNVKEHPIFQDSKQRLKDLMDERTIIPKFRDVEEFQSFL